MSACRTGCFERPSLSIAWAAISDIGKARQLNEDSYLAADGLFVVADGMGGHRAGDIASQLAIDVCRDHLDRVPLALADVEQLVDVANRRVRERAETDGTTGMGTTLVGVALVDNAGDLGLLVVNVGDSRCYSSTPADGLVQLTHDHSVVQELLDAGSLSIGAARGHPERNVITRAIGIQPAVAADFVVLPSRDQRLLICSDGVSSQLDAEMLAECLSGAGDARSAVESLMEAVLAGAAPDNATAIVLDVEWDHDRDAERADLDDEITAPRAVVLDAALEITVPTGVVLPTPPGPAGVALIDAVPLAPRDALSQGVVSDPYPAEET